MRSVQPPFRASGSSRWLVVLLVLCGCNLDGDSLKSRWAMSDPKYAQQYTAPYQSNTLKKMSRMGQELIDARFEEGKVGVYASAGGADKHRAALGGEVGVFKLPTSWSTLRLGLVGLVADGLPSYLVGGVAGARVHFPTRFSPYVGLSGMAGYAQQVSTTTTTTFDNNGNLVPAGTKIYGPSAGLAAIVPEAGLYYWLTPNARLSLGSSYYVTTDGRDKDFLFTGLGFEFVPSDWREGPPYEPPPSAVHESNRSDASEPYFRSENNLDCSRTIETISQISDNNDQSSADLPESESKKPAASKPPIRQLSPDISWDE